MVDFFSDDVMTRILCVLVQLHLLLLVGMVLVAVDDAELGAVAVVVQRVEKVLGLLKGAEGFAILVLRPNPQVCQELVRLDVAFVLKLIQYLLNIHQFKLSLQRLLQTINQNLNITHIIRFILYLGQDLYQFLKFLSGLLSQLLQHMVVLGVYRRLFLFVSDVDQIFLEVF